MHSWIHLNIVRKKNVPKRKEKIPSKIMKVSINQTLGNVNSDSEFESNIFDDNVVFDRLPENPVDLKDLLNDVKHKTKYYKQLFIKEQEELKSKIYFNVR